MKRMIKKNLVNVCIIWITFVWYNQTNILLHQLRLNKDEMHLLRVFLYKIYKKLLVQKCKNI